MSDLSILRCASLQRSQVREDLKERNWRKIGSRHSRPGNAVPQHPVDSQVGIAMIVFRSGQRGSETTRPITAVALRALFAKDARARLSIVLAGVLAELDSRFEAVAGGAIKPCSWTRHRPKLNPRKLRDSALRLLQI